MQCQIMVTPTLVTLLFFLFRNGSMHSMEGVHQESFGVSVSLCWLTTGADWAWRGISLSASLSMSTSVSLFSTSGSTSMDNVIGGLPQTGVTSSMVVLLAGSPSCVSADMEPPRRTGSISLSCLLSRYNRHDNLFPLQNPTSSMQVLGMR